VKTKSYLLLIGSFLVFNLMAQDLFAPLDEDYLPPLDDQNLLPLGNQINIFTQSPISNPEVIADFYRRRRPPIVKSLPARSDGERLYWHQGDTLYNFSLPQGEYSIVRIHSLEHGFFIRYLGKLYSNSTDSYIRSANTEIQRGDHLVKNFEPKPLPPQTNRIGLIDTQDGRALGTVRSFFEPGRSETIFRAAQRQLVAGKFYRYTGSRGGATSVGAVFSIKRNREPIGRAIVVDNDLDLATLYVLESYKEIQAGDELHAR
jgi:hypothetical protein